MVRYSIFVSVKLGFNYAFPSGEGGPLAVDEENTVCAKNRLSRLHIVYKSKEITLKAEDLVS